MVDEFFSGFVFDESGGIIGWSYYFYNPDRQYYMDYKTDKVYKRAKFNDSWTNWIEVID